MFLNRSGRRGATGYPASQPAIFAGTESANPRDDTFDHAAWALRRIRGEVGLPRATAYPFAYRGSGPAPLHRGRESHAGVYALRRAGTNSARAGFEAADSQLSGKSAGTQSRAIPRPQEWLCMRSRGARAAHSLRGCPDLGSYGKRAVEPQPYCAHFANAGNATSSTGTGHSIGWLQDLR